MATLKHIKVAIDVISKYISLDDEQFAAGHDVLWLPLIDGMSKEDVETMEEAGWFKEEDIASWSRFC